jgi:thiol-disulfide isomerase/thioredoxin
MAPKTAATARIAQKKQGFQMKNILIASLLFILPLGLKAVIPAGNQAPSFFLSSLSGQQFFLSKHVGAKAKAELKSPIVMSFFATWCLHCKEEIQLLHELQAQYPEVKLLLVNVEEDPELVKKYIEAKGITLDILMDRYSVVAKKYGVVDENKIAHLPSLVIINADGKLIYTQEGYNEESKAKLLQSLAVIN